MPVIMDYNLDVSADRYARLASAFGIDTSGMSEREAAQRAVDYVRELNADLGIPALAELIRPDDLDLLAEKAAANTSAPSNPRDVDAAAFRDMFETAFPAHAA
jgi:alcohol dehydrogenase class IV